MNEGNHLGEKYTFNAFSMTIRSHISTFLLVPVLIVILSAATAFGSGSYMAFQDTSSHSSNTETESDFSAQEIQSGSLTAYIDGIIENQRREHKLSAITLSVIQGDSLLFARGYGLADIESNRPVQADQTLFRIGSVSKTFTWTAVMMLSEQGLLDLDTNVNEYLSDVQVNEAFDEPVTMRHLMSHRAGFEDTIRLFTVADDDPRSLSELLSEHQPKRIYPPGHRTSYSNWGAALAAQVVEDVSGISYKVFLKEEILNPLGMNSTILDTPIQMTSDHRDLLATGYKTRQGALNFQNFMQIGEYWPAGGMASTATDMARWMRFHLNGGELDGVRLLSADTHEQMWTRAYNDRPQGADVSHGFQDRPYRGLRLLGHAGGTAAFLTNMIMIPELNMGIFLSQNGAESSSLINRMPTTIIDYVRNDTYQPYLFEESSVDEAEELAGTFINNRRVFSTFSAIMGLGMATSLSTVSENAIVLSSFGESTYYKKISGQEDVFENADGERLTVIRNDKGSVSALADGMGVHTLERVGFFKNPNTFFGVFGLAVLLTFTTLMGTWRRFGHGKNPGFSSGIASFARFLASLAVITFVVAAVYLLVSFADFDLSMMSENYPSFAMYFTHYAGWGVALMSLITIIGLWPVWTDSGWNVLRRLHYSLYAFTILFLTILLWQWRIIGAAVI